MLKERLIAALERRPSILEMTQHMRVVRWDLIKYNLAGLILRESGYSLQSSDSGPRLSLNAPLLDKKWFEYEFGCEISALARQLWEAEYGDKEARELPFYAASVSRGGSYWWDDLADVSARHVVFYLRGERDIYNLNGPTQPDD